MKVICKIGLVLIIFIQCLKLGENFELIFCLKFIELNLYHNFFQDETFSGGNQTSEYKDILISCIGCISTTSHNIYSFHKLLTNICH